ncbi:MAG: SseB family protein [Streptococcus sp.]|nr:SseB family protein [Streptococcus sp.]
MGLFDFLFGKKKENTTVVFGVEEILPTPNDSEDLVVIGLVRGTIHVGDEVIITNLGSDNDKAAKAVISALEDANKGQVKKASGDNVVVTIKDGKKHNVYKGTVLHFEGVSEDDLRASYLYAIINAFFFWQNGILMDEDRRRFSIADLIEIWRQSIHFCDTQASDENYAYYFEKIIILMEQVRATLLTLDEIYAVYSVKTGEPALFISSTRNKDGSLEPAETMVRLIPTAYKEKITYPDEFELRCIENGLNKDGILNFLNEVIFLNGAEGIEFISDKTSINAKALIKSPDLEGMREVDKPIMNPDVVRCLLMLGQIGDTTTLGKRDRDFLSKLYLNRLTEALKTARFIVPIKVEGELPKPNEKGETSFAEDVKYELAMKELKDNKKAVPIFTDWKRFNEEYGDGWRGLLQPLGGPLIPHPVLINGTLYFETGNETKDSE